MRSDLYTKFVLTVIALLLLVLFWNTAPRTVKAQGRIVDSVQSNQGCTSSTPSAPSSSSNNGFSYYPLFACAVDLDGTGTREVVVGLGSNVGSGYKVVIMNGTGTIRATVSAQ